MKRLSITRRGSADRRRRSSIFQRGVRPERRLGDAGRRQEDGRLDRGRQSQLGDEGRRAGRRQDHRGQGSSYLVSKTSYKDFQIKAEFWADDDANSGIFIRCDQSAKIDAKICYEVNIFDKRPDPTYGTGAIVDVAKVDPMPKAGGKWNTYEITAKGPHLVVVLNGQKTVDVQDFKARQRPVRPAIRLGRDQVAQGADQGVVITRPEKTLLQDKPTRFQRVGFFVSCPRRVERLMKRALGKSLSREEN